MSHHDHRSCVDACMRCAQECEHCASACLDEPDVRDLAECIRLDLDCAKVCSLAVSFMSGGSSFSNDICRICAEICEACGAECRKHDMGHCQTCADACDACAEECRRMSDSVVR